MKSLRLIIVLTLMALSTAALAEPTGGVIFKPTGTAIQPSGS